MRIGPIVNPNRLTHHFVIDMEAPGRVDNQNINVLSSRIVKGAIHDRLGSLVDAARTVDGTNLSGQPFELEDGSGPMHIDTDKHYLLPLLLYQTFRKLCRSCRFSRALQARQEQHNGRLRSKIQRRSLAAQHVHQFVVNNLCKRLSGCQALANFLAKRFFTNVLDKRLDDRQRNVGLE